MVLRRRVGVLHPDDVQPAVADRVRVQRRSTPPPCRAQLSGGDVHEAARAHARRRARRGRDRAPGRGARRSVTKGTGRRPALLGGRAVGGWERRSRVALRAQGSGGCPSGRTGAPDHRLRLVGYGMVGVDRVQAALANDACLIASDSVDEDHWHLYAVPVPANFANGSGRRGVTVALAFDPPVRASRREYLARTMWVEVLKGLTIDEAGTSGRGTRAKAAHRRSRSQSCSTCGPRRPTSNGRRCKSYARSGAGSAGCPSLLARRSRCSMSSSVVRGISPTARERGKGTDWRFDSGTETRRSRSTSNCRPGFGHALARWFALGWTVGDEMRFALASRALTGALFRATTPRQPELAQAQQDQTLARAARSAPFRRSVPRGEPKKAQAIRLGLFSCRASFVLRARARP